MSHFKENASLPAKHAWMNRHFGKPMKCEECKKTYEKTLIMHWANISGEYKRVRSDWRRLCISCHRKFDYSRGQRHARGEDYKSAVLTEKQVRDIKMSYKPFVVTMKDLALKHSVNYHTVHSIIYKRNWKHV